MFWGKTLCCGSGKNFLSQTTFGGACDIAGSIPSACRELDAPASHTYLSHSCVPCCAPTVSCKRNTGGEGGEGGEPMTAPTPPDDDQHRAGKPLISASVEANFRGRPFFFLIHS